MLTLLHARANSEWLAIYIIYFDITIYTSYIIIMYDITYIICEIKTDVRAII